MADCDRGRVIGIPNQIRSTEIQQRDNTPLNAPTIHSFFSPEKGYAAIAKLNPKWF